LVTQGNDVKVVRIGMNIMNCFIGLQSELSIKKIYDSLMDYRGAIAIYEKLGSTLSCFVPNNDGHFPILVETDCIMIRNDLL